MTDLPEWHELGVEDARRVEDETFGGASAPAVETEDVTVPLGSRDVAVRVYRPPGVEAPAPGLVFAHGGGFVLGTLDSADDLAARLATGTDSVVVSVDYRLAPEHPFPAGLADVEALTRLVLAGSDEFGIDPDRVGVAGSSAGANLAATVARRLRDEPAPAGGRTSLTCQLLFYPMLDPRCDRRSHVEHADGPLLTRRDLVWFWALYQGDDEVTATQAAAHVAAGGEGAAVTRGAAASGGPPDLSPLERGSYRNLPPAVVVTGGVDPLRDEGRAYAAALADAGVPVADLHYPGMCHGFLSLADVVPAAADAWDDVEAAVRRYR
nr:alpha/beta hydrolase [Haloarchaeobius amylolyticus]